MTYHPPFSLTNKLITQIAEIAELIGMWKAANNNTLVPQLRKGNRIKTIQASLAVEQNTLSIEQVTAILAGKTVLGLPRESQEVRNAFQTYDAMESWDPCRVEDILAAHGLLMHGLLDNAGRWRTSGSGIFKGDEVAHVPPPASQLPRLMSQLMEWLKTTDAHPLIRSAAFHYEFEYIHPFSDGNGRMGRLWQTLILSRWQPMLAYLPVETVIKHRQSEYYQLLQVADKNSDCTDFISFLLQAIIESLHEAIAVQPQDEKTRVEMKVENPSKEMLKTPQKILNILATEPELTLSDIAYVLELSQSTIERAVAKLKKADKLEFVGPRKGGRWVVKD